MITGGTIKRLVADEFGVTVIELTGGSSARRLARPRWVAMWLVRTVLGYSLPQIGKAFGRDHTSVQHALRQLADLRDHDAELADRMDRLAAACQPCATDIPADQIPDAAARMVDALVDEFRSKIHWAARRDPQAFVARALAWIAEGEPPCAP